MLLLIGATTGFAKDEFEVDANEENRRFFTMEWIDVVDDNNRKFVCGTKVSTFDYTGRKLVLKYYYIITNENKIVTRFDVNAVQASVLEMKPLKTEEFKINLYGAIIVKDGEDLEAIKAKKEQLVQSSLKLGEAIYKQNPQAGDQTPNSEAEGTEPSSDKKDEKVVDADFEEVDESKENKKD